MDTVFGLFISDAEFNRLIGGDTKDFNLDYDGDGNVCGGNIHGYNMYSCNNESDAKGYVIVCIQFDPHSVDNPTISATDVIAFSNFVSQLVTSKRVTSNMLGMYLV